MIPKSHPYYLALCGVETLAADHSELQESDDREQDGNGDRYAFIDLFIYAQISSDFKSLSSLQCGTKMDKDWLIYKLQSSVHSYLFGFLILGRRVGEGKEWKGRG